MKELLVTSTMDGSEQPVLFYLPETPAPVPLIVGLHTWSYDRFNQMEQYLPLCRKYGWALLLPEFRGPNLPANPNAKDACGAAVARQDILDAVASILNQYPIQRDNLFLLGCSGGGHMALLTAVQAPTLFRAVDVWCPVTDLPRWYEESLQTHPQYARGMEACLGGTLAEKRQRYLERSPNSYLDQLSLLTLSIHHGKQDDVVPYTHSLDLVTALEKQKHHALYYDFFDGGHEQYPDHSFQWFSRLAKQGNDAVRITG